MCVYACVCASASAVCAACVFVCVLFGQRQRERETGKEGVTVSRNRFSGNWEPPRTPHYI